jgi:hypothetical protein
VYTIAGSLMAAGLDPTTASNQSIGYPLVSMPRYTPGI